MGVGGVIRGERVGGGGGLTYAAAAARLQEAPRSAFGVFRERVLLQQFRVGAQSQDLRGANGSLIPAVHISVGSDKTLTVACSGRDKLDQRFKEDGRKWQKQDEKEFAYKFGADRNASWKM